MTSEERDELYEAFGLNRDANEKDMLFAIMAKLLEMERSRPLKREIALDAEAASFREIVNDYVEAAPFPMGSTAQGVYAGALAKTFVKARG